MHLRQLQNSYLARLRFLPLLANALAVGRLLCNYLICLPVFVMVLRITAIAKEAFIKAKWEARTCPYFLSSYCWI